MTRIENPAHFAVAVVGKDRPGIVAAATGALYQLGCNIEDSSSTMLGGEFSMILIVGHEKPFTKTKLLEGFKALSEEMGLTVSVRPLSRDESLHRAAEGELCMISVYGSDRPGIVYRVARALADQQVNITDLNTKLIGTEQEPVYVMMLEAVLPENVTIDELAALLDEIKKELNVEIAVRSITPVSL